MAIMIPSRPLDVEKRSGEDRIFEILKRSLPNNVYVAHSFVIKDEDIITGDSYECEIDFLVIIPDVGCLIIESKNAKIYPEIKSGLSYNYDKVDYLWHLPTGETMKYNGPFRQAERAKRKFEKYLKEGRAAKFGFSGKVIFSYCVLLPLIDKGTINKWTLPADAGSVEFVLSKDDINSKESGFLYRRLIEIISLQKKEKDYKCMDDNECKSFIQSVVAPPCNLLPSKHFFNDLQEERLDSFLQQQLVILEFMEEQKIAVIGGGAGTGKTKIALEKARKLSENGEKVLFLCFNKKLKEHLSCDYPFKNVRYETIDSLYYSYFNDFARENYNPLKSKIETDYSNDLFPYKNFIIDEAQDFGRKDIEGSGLLKLLQDIVELEDKGCCYFFYDKYQLVQSKEIPSVILNADCKMMLYKNCRNTEKIANTSYKLFKDEELSKRDIKGFEPGDTPKAINCDRDKVFDNVSNMVDYLKSKGRKDIVILTVKEEGGSTLSNYVKNEFIFINGFKCMFTTCRKFKGLEASAIIIVDIDAEILLSDEKRLLFYVGASRAKFDLNLVFNLTDDECKTFINKIGKKFPYYSKEHLYSIFACGKFI